MSILISSVITGGVMCLGIYKAIVSHNAWSLIFCAIICFVVWIFCFIFCRVAINIIPLLLKVSVYGGIYG